MWAQGVLPEWMYPKDIGVIVSVKSWPQGQWLEVVECGVEMVDDVINSLVEFKAPLVYTKSGKLFLVGPPEFKEFYKNYVKTVSNLLPPVSD